MMMDANHLRGTAEQLRGRAESVAQEPIRAQLLALADYYDGMAEDIEQPVTPAAAPAASARR